MTACDPGTAEWFAARAGKITASRVADVLKKLKNGDPSADRKNYLIEVVAERLRGEALSHFASTAMAWGNDQEPVAKSRYEAITGRIIQPAPFVTHPLLPFFGATPDGYFDDGGLIEIKCPFNSAVHVGTMLSGTIPPEHIPQVQAQLSVTAQMWCDFVSYDPRMPEGLDMFIVRVERDKDFIDYMEVEVQIFDKEATALVERLRTFQQGNMP